MENQLNQTDSRKIALTPRQAVALPHIAATESLSWRGGPEAAQHRQTLDAPHGGWTDPAFRAELERMQA